MGSKIGFSDLQKKEDTERYAFLYLKAVYIIFFFSFGAIV